MRQVLSSDRCPIGQQPGTHQDKQDTEYTRRNESNAHDVILELLLVTNGNRGFSHRGNWTQDVDRPAVSRHVGDGLVAVRKTVGCIVISQIWCDPKTIQTTTSSHSSPAFFSGVQIIKI